MVNEAANSFGTGDHVEIATAPEYNTQTYLPLYPGALEGGFSSKVAEQFTSTSEPHDLLDSKLNDNEDVANCLLSPEEPKIRARNWMGEDHEDPAPLNARSLMKSTGIDKCVVQDLYEERQAAQKQAVFVTASLKEDEVIISNNEDFLMQHPRVYSRGNVNHRKGGSTKKLHILESECSDADSDGGAHIKDSYQSSGTPGTHACSVTSRSTESKEALPLAAGTAATGNRMPEILPLSGKLTQQTQIWIPADRVDLYVVKRIHRRSAPGALDLSHDRSNSETTLVDSPPLQPATASQLEPSFPLVRPSAPKHVGCGSQRLDGFKCALRIEQAIEETREATNREWESANAAAELRHDCEIEELKEDQQATIIDLQEKHQEDLKKVRKKHGDKMKNLRGEVARARSENTAMGETLKNMSTEGDVLRDELRAKDEQLERAIAAAQAIQANNNIYNRQWDVQSDYSADRWTQLNYNGPLTGLTLALYHQLEQQATQFDAVAAQLRDDLTQCQQTRDWYMEKSEKYHTALVRIFAEKPLVQLEQGREEELVELRFRLSECEASLDDEQRVRKAEVEMFSNQVMSMREGIRRHELDAQAMQLSRKAALAANQANIRMMRRPMSDNEIDTAFWEQYRIVQKDYQELRQNADGHEQQKVEKEEEINMLKAKILEVEMQGPKDQKRVYELEEDVRRLEFDYETALHERDIAIQDQEKREPELWKSIRDKQLLEKDEKIARLEAQLQKQATEEDDSGPRTPSSIARYTSPGGIATPAQGGTPWPLFGNEEATRPEYFWTPSRASSSGSHFGNK